MRLIQATLLDEESPGEGRCFVGGQIKIAHDHFGWFQSRWVFPHPSAIVQWIVNNQFCLEFQPIARNRWADYTGPWTHLGAARSSTTAA